METSTEQIFNARNRIGVLIGGKLTKEPNDECETDAIESKTSKPERDVHEPMLVVKQVIFVMKMINYGMMSGIAMDVHPLEEILIHLREKQRDTEEENPRESGAKVFEGAANGSPPP